MRKSGQDRWRDRLLSFDAEIAITGEPAARARLHHAAGRLLEERLERHREALARYRQANVEDPGYRPALKDARRLYRAGGQHLMVADVLSREAECAPSPGERSTLLWDRGHALEAAEGDPRDIRAAYEAALRADPSSLPALHSLVTVLRRDGDWAGLSGAYREAAAATADITVRAGILCDLARLCELHLSDVEAACTLYAEAAETDPTHLVALVELERLARRLGRHHLLAKTLQWTAQLSAVGPDAAHDWEEVARIRFHCVDDEPGAVDAMRRALEADPAHVPSFDRTEELLRDQGAWTELAELYHRRALVTVGPEQKAAVLCQQAQVLETHLHQAEAAAQAYSEAASVCATYLPALRALGAKLEASSDWLGLVRLYLSEAAAQEDPEVRSDRLLRAAELLDRKVGDPERAIEVLRRAVQSGTGRLAATRQLVALLSRQGLWFEAAGVLREESARTLDATQQVEHLRRLADIRETHLADSEGAADALADLLAAHPDDVDARWDLVRLCRQLGRWEQVVHIRETEAESLSDPRGVAAALFESGEVREIRLDDLKGAEESYRAALTTHPGYVPALRALGRMLQSAGRWEALVQMYQRDLEVEVDDDRRAESLLRMADVLWRRLGREQEAEEAFLQAIALHPGDHAALSSLETIYRAWGDADSLTGVLEQRIVAADDPADRARLLCALAEVLEDEGAPDDQVVDAWTRAVSQDSGCLPALRALARLHEESGRWDEMAQVLEQESDAGGDAVRSLLRSLRLASLRRDRIGDDDGALEAYRRAIAADPGHLPALQALDSALRELGSVDRDARAQVLDTLASVLEDPKTVAASRVELARLLEGAGDLDGALERYAEALRLEPGNVVAMEAMEAAHRAEGDWGALARLYQSVHAEAADPEMKVDLALRAARALDRAGDPAGAREVLEEAAAHRSGDAVLLSELVDARERDGDRISALDAAEALARLHRSKDRAVSELLACGDAWRDQENSPQRALQLYQDAFLLAPAHTAAVERVEAMLREQGDTEALIVSLERGREAATVPAVRAAIGRRLARVLRETDRLEEAKEALARALHEAADDVEALQAQAEVLQDLGETTQAAESWERLTRHARSEEDLRDAWLSVARLCADRPDQAERAQVALRFILERWPEDVEGLTLLQLQAETVNALERAVDAAERLAALETERRARVERLLDIARLHRERHDTDNEADALRRAREADQAASEPVARLGDLLRLTADTVGIERLYREYAEGLSASEQARAVPFLLELGEIRREAGDADRAVADFAEVLHLAPDCDDARFALADLYSDLPDGADKAVAQHRDLLARDPFRVDSYRALARLFERTREYDRAFIVGGILEYLAALDDEDRPLLADLRARCPAAPRGKLDQDDRLRFLRHADEGDGVRIWLQSLAPVAERLCTATAKDLGARRSARITDRDEDPLKTLLYRLIDVTGVGGVELYRVAEGDLPVVALPGSDGKVIIAEEQLSALDLGARRFHLARALSLSADAAGLVADRGAEWTAVALATMSDSGGVHGDLKVVDSALRKEAEGATRDVGIKRLRKFAGEQSDRVRAGLPFDRIVVQLEAALRTADRVGLLAAGDATAGLRTIGGPFPSTYSTAERITALRQRPAVRDALAFLLSEEHSALRTRVGLTLR